MKLYFDATHLTSQEHGKRSRDYETWNLRFGNICLLCKLQKVSQNLQVAFLRYPPDIGSVVPIVMATHLAGVLVFCSPELGYKLGQVTTADPLLSSYVGLACSFLVLVLYPFVTR